MKRASDLGDVMLKRHSFSILGHIVKIRDITTMRETGVDLTFGDDHRSGTSWCSR